MPIHRVGPAESLDTIARQYRLRPGDIWAASENSELRARRRDPDVLREGDELFIPEMEAKRVSVSTHRTNVFVYAPRWHPVRLRFRAHGRPRARVAAKVKIDSDEAFDATLTAEGELRFEVRHDAEIAEVKLYPETPRELVYRFRLRHLEPEGEVRGAQQRLRNLGFNCGDDDGTVGDATRRAIRFFQRARRLPVTGELDDATMTALRARHGA